MWQIIRVFTSAEREVKESRRSGMYQSCFFGTGLGKQSLQILGLILEITSISLDLFFNLLEKERNIIWAFPGFEPTHLCDPSDQKRLRVEGLADCATATEGSLGYEK